MRRSPLVLLFSLAACNGAGVSPLIVDIVTPSGASPLAADAGVTHVHIDVREGTRPAEVIDDDTSSPGYTHDWGIHDISASVATRVTLTLAGGGTLIGAAPDFVPAATDGVVRIPVGPPSTCAVVSGLTFATPRTTPSVVVVASESTFPVVAGEPDPASGLDKVESIDQVQLVPFDVSVLDPLPIGSARFVQLGTAAALAISRTGDAASTYVIASDGTVTQQALPLLYSGVQSAAALPFDTNRVIVLGGAMGTTAVRDVVLVGTDGGVDRTSLMPLAAARRAPAAVVLADGRVLVAGGADGPTDPVAELEALSTAPVTIAGPIDGIRRGATVFTNADRTAAILIGGVDDAGRGVSTTVVFTGCPAACAAAAGPPFPDARAGATPLALPAGGGLLVGGNEDGIGPDDRITRVQFAGAVPSFTTTHALAAPRGAPAVYVLPSGLVFILQGLGADLHGRTDAEVCFPDALTPIP